MKGATPRAAARRILSGSVAALAMWSCGGEGDTSGATSGGGSGPPIACGSAEVLVDSRCTPVGVPADACAPGFVASDGGCEPVLPGEACPPGTMALPGDTSCGPVAPCGSGPWGDIPVEANTVFVDDSYTAMDSDGSAAKPYPTIQQGLLGAPSGAIVAVAQGTYAGPVHISLRPARVWGVCPEKVSITGATDPTLSTVEVIDDATGSELRGIGLTAINYGVSVSNAAALVEGVWIHDTGAQAVSSVDSLGPASITLRHCLVETGTDAALFASGGALHVERSVIRDTRTGAASGIGAGISYQVSPTMTSSIGTLDGSVVSGHRGAGVAVAGSQLEVDASVIHDILPIDVLEQDGEGIVALPGVPGGTPSDLSVAHTSIARAHEAGILVLDSSAVVRTTTISEIRPQASDQDGGVGVAAEKLGVGTQSVTLTLDAVMVQDTPGFGVLVANAALTATSLYVRRTTPLISEEVFGDALTLVRLDQATSGVVSASRFEASARAGLSSFGADLALGASMLECNGIDLDGEATAAGEHRFEDRGGNDCGCGAARIVCRMATTNLALPEPL